MTPHAATGVDRGPDPDLDPDPHLDGRRFAMVSSTATEVDRSAPTIFTYHERDGMVWGEYEGDTVRAGRFVGVREGRRVAIRFVHVLESGGRTVEGAAVSRIETHDDGLRLVEGFSTPAGDQVSVCAELPDPVPSRSPRRDRRRRG